MTQTNPYQTETFEHKLWETWNRQFFRQPVHAQILEVEHQLRQQVHALNALAREMDAGPRQRRLTESILAIETRAEELNEIAEHQLMAIVIEGAKRGSGPT